MTNATVNRDLAVLRHALKLAVRKWRWLRQEPFIELLPESGARERELSEEDEARLLEASPPEFRLLVTAALATGMRESGLAGWIGDSVTGLSSLPPWIILLAVAALFVFLTEVTSNVATT